MKHKAELYVLILAFNILCVVQTAACGMGFTHDGNAGSGRIFHPCHAGTHNRKLLQSGACPPGCLPDRCVADGTSSTLICTRCVSGLVVTSGKCGCRPGRYYTRTGGAQLDVYNNTPACALCDVGNYCVGGTITAPSGSAPAQTSCASLGAGLTGTVRGATSKFQCVEKAGWGYQVVAGQPTAVKCFNNTYNEGFKKGSCQTCPSGFEINDSSKATDPAPGRHDSVADCVVPPGYYQRATWEVAPCPQGEYQPSFNRAWRCLKCPSGVTTQPNKIYSHVEFCNTLLPGVFTNNLKAVVVQTAAVTGSAYYMDTPAIACPQNHWCAGGVPTESYTDLALPPATGSLVKRCSVEYGVVAGINTAPLWTRARGSQTRDQCLVPPGHGLSSGALVACVAGQYKELWTAAVNASAPACQACAEDPDGAVTSMATYVLAVYPNLTSLEEEQILVFGSSKACRMDPGYGMIQTTRGFRAQACNSNAYGNSEYTYGLGLAPCKGCATNLVTNDLASATEYKNANGTGFTDVKACVTRPGFGWDGRVSTQCAVGTYNPGHNRDECTQCDWGLTTADNPNMQASASDCKVSPGYQSIGGAVQECPRGTYNDQLLAAGVPCTACPGNTWTYDTQSTAATECEACQPGYGKPSSANYTEACTDCAAVVINGESYAGYGPLEREGTDCVLCPAQETGFTFIYGGDIQPFAAKSVIKPAQTSATGCVSEFAQIEAGVWYLEGASVTDAADNIESCAAACGSDCMFFTFDYQHAACLLAIHSQPATPEEILAFKAVPAGDVMAFSKAKDSVQKKAVPSGLYTQWPVSPAQASTIGVADASINTVSKLECMVACNNDPLCAAVRMAGATIDGDAISSCSLVKGTSEAGVLAGMQKLGHRSLTHVVVSRLTSSLV